VGLGVGDLLVKGEEGDLAVERLSRLGGDSDDLEAGGVDLLGELVDGNIRRGADKDLAGVHLGEVVDDRGGGDGFSGSGRTLPNENEIDGSDSTSMTRKIERRGRTNLDETERLLKDTLDSSHLRVIELGKTRSGEPDEQALRLTWEKRSR
jgi:hypothetical protein